MNRALCVLLLTTAAAAEVFTQAASIAFLLRHRPVHDSGVDVSQHASLALQARAASAWAAEVPWPIFCDACLPYACLDEPRQEWRPMLRERCAPLVADAKSAADAALTLNSRIWDLFSVRYEPNLSPQILAPLDVIKAGKASCSGLSLLLVACCRSVGVPARVAGVGDWGAAHGGGNHVWCEVYSGGEWHHIGSAEPSALSETWFDERLWPADGPRVFASTYVRCDEPDDEIAFPLPWRDTTADREREGRIRVPALEVTQRYRERAA